MQNKRGFTLMEVLIAASVFGMLSVIAATFFLNISQSQRTTDSYSALYEDARVIMENLANEIRNGTVDYEEYFNITSGDIKSSPRYYGTNRGVYASRFYDPGYVYNDGAEPASGINPADLGVKCLTAPAGDPKTVSEVDCDDSAGISTFSLSVDKDMGKNPYNSVEGTESSAMSSNDQPELYLISKDGRNKTIVIKQQISEGKNDFVLSVLRLVGADTDNNGVVDGFFCTTETKGCDPAIAIKPFENSSKFIAKYPTGVFGLSSPFTPISPFRSNVKDIHFIITPTEDPYKAFDEPGAQIHPSVTIVMTLEPSTEEKAKLPTEQQNQSITVQTTVSTGLTSRLKTYPPTSDLRWIKDAVNQMD